MHLDHGGFGVIGKGRVESQDSFCQRHRLTRDALAGELATEELQDLNCDRQLQLVDGKWTVENLT